MGEGEAAVIPQVADQRLSDEEVIARVARGEVALFEVVMRRYNQRLYRTARAITGDDREAEDVVQKAYVRAWPRATPRSAGQATPAEARCPIGRAR